LEWVYSKVLAQESLASDIHALVACIGTLYTHQEQPKRTPPFTPLFQTLQQLLLQAKKYDAFVSPEDKDHILRMLHSACTITIAHMIQNPLQHPHAVRLYDTLKSTVKGYYDLETSLQESLAVSSFHVMIEATYRITQSEDVAKAIAMRLSLTSDILSSPKIRLTANEKSALESIYTNTVSTLSILSYQIHHPDETYLEKQLYPNRHLRLHRQSLFHRRPRNNRTRPKRPHRQALT
jgi:hypothetical protein